MEISSSSKGIDDHYKITFFIDIKWDEHKSIFDIGLGLSGDKSIQGIENMY